MAFTFRSLLSLVGAALFFVPLVGPLAGLAISANLARALTIGGIILTALGTKRPALERQEVALKTTLTPGTPLPVVYGRAKIGSVVADWFIDPATKDKVLYVIAALCHGSRDGLGIAAVEEIWLDHRRAAVVAGDVRTHPYHAVAFDYKVFLGTTTQNVGNTQLTGLNIPTYPAKSPAQVTDSGWSATTDKGAGVACLSCRFLNITGYQQLGDPSSGRAPVFRGPPAITVIVKGNRVFDTRTSTWIAGHDNPAMCIRDYLLSPIYGPGFQAAWIHEASFQDAANYCDDLVDYTPSSVGTSLQKRYTCNGVVDTGQSIEQNLAELLSTCRGQLVWEQGQFKLVIRRETEAYLSISGTGVPDPVLTLNPVNIHGEWRFVNAGVKEKWNLVKATYVDPVNGEFKAREVQWPRAGDSNLYLASDAGLLNRLDLSLPFTNDQLMAQSIAQVTLNESRQGLGVQVRCSEEALQLSVGDLVNVTHPTPGWTAKPFWVARLDLLADSRVDVTLQEFDIAAYLIDTMDDVKTVPDTALDSLTSVPPPGVVTVFTHVTHDHLHIAWNSADYGLVDFYEVEARQTNGDNVYRHVARVPGFGALREATVFNVRNGQTWQARVRTVNVAAHWSEWTQSVTHVAVIHDVPTVAITLTPTSQGVEITVSNYDADGDGINADRVELYVRENAAQGGANPLETEQYRAATFHPGDGAFLEPAGNTRWVRAFAVPYNAFNERGIATAVAEAQSGAAGAGPDGPPTALACTNCTAGVSNFPEQIDITWTDGDAAGAVTRIYLDGVQIRQVALGASPESITGLESDTNYVIGLRHLENGIFNPLESSSPVQITVKTLKGTLGVPQNLASVSEQFSKVKLTWTPGTDGTNASYVIERSPDGTTGWTQIGTVGVGVLQFTHTDVGQGGVQWFFRVKAQRTKWNDSVFTSAVAGTYGADLRIMRPDGTMFNEPWTNHVGEGSLHANTDDVTQDGDATYTYAEKTVNFGGQCRVSLTSIGAAFSAARPVKVKTTARRSGPAQPVGAVVDTSMELYHALTQVWQFDDSAAAFVDETVDANDADANDWAFFPAGAGVNDYVAVGFAQKFSRMSIEVGTAGAGTYTVTWEYWNGTAWAALSGVTDSTNHFKFSGRNSISFTVPSDWAARVLNGSASLFYVRGRRDGGTVTTDPLGTQGRTFIGLSPIFLDMSDSYVEYVWTLTQAQIDMIADHTTLEVEVNGTWAFAPGQSGATQHRITKIEVDNNA